MIQKSFYLDSCIWLNLFKKEGDPSKGKPYWKIAEEFIDKIITSGRNIIYSGFVIKEIKFRLDEYTFKEKLKFLNKEFIFVDAIKEDKSFARKLESESNYEISYYDCLHIAICKRLNLIIITRDKELIKFARNYIRSYKPEDLLSKFIDFI